MDRRTNKYLRARIRNIQQLVLFRIYTRFDAATVLRDLGVPMDIAMRTIGGKS